MGCLVAYELNYMKQALYIILMQSILGKVPVVPVFDTWVIPLIPFHLLNVYDSEPGLHIPCASNGCRMWCVNSWALGWSCEM
jgi:hypothetical protein